MSENKLHRSEGKYRAVSSGANERRAYITTSWHITKLQQPHQSLLRLFQHLKQVAHPSSAHNALSNPSRA